MQKGRAAVAILQSFCEIVCVSDLTMFQVHIMGIVSVSLKGLVTFYDTAFFLTCFSWFIYHYEGRDGSDIIETRLQAVQPGFNPRRAQ
jgi:hypothetical protein